MKLNFKKSIITNVFSLTNHLSIKYHEFNLKSAEYQKHNFHANQDYPGNFMWEDLYNASPNAKVILTVRDSDEQFVNSWNKFIVRILS